MTLTEVLRASNDQDRHEAADEIERLRSVMLGVAHKGMTTHQLGGRSLAIELTQAREDLASLVGSKWDPRTPTKSGEGNE